MERDEGKKSAEESQAEDSDLIHYEDGVDPSLIRWMLAMTPGERLATLERTVRSMLGLRNARFIS